MKNFVITVAQQKGGAGKTTVAAHLAVSLAQAGYRVAMIDIDPQGSLGTWYKSREQQLGEDYTGLKFVSATGWQLSGEIANLREKHDVVIIDSPPHVQTEARAAIRQADLVLVPVQPSPLDLWATQATLDYAKSENIKTHIVMNRVNAQSRIFQLINEEMQGSAASVLGNRVAFASSILSGLGVSEAEPYSPATKEIKALTDDVKKYFSSTTLMEKPKISSIRKRNNATDKVRITELS